jgi:O-methyltransferase
MVSYERLVANADAVKYVIRREIPGAIVECGVWRGGSILIMIRVLQSLGVDDRDVYLFDTFEGMTLPTDRDTSAFDEPALQTWRTAEAVDEKPWAEMFDEEFFDLERLRELVLGTRYPSERIHFVEGRVEDTLPGNAPSDVSVLRLDTDWYESTKHELIHLFPRLAAGGVLIIDDYGHWEGARRAVDEYFQGAGRPLLFSRIDYTGRLAVKH